MSSGPRTNEMLSKYPCSAWEDNLWNDPRGAFWNSWLEADWHRVFLFCHDFNVLQGLPTVFPASSGKCWCPSLDWLCHASSTIVLLVSTKRVRARKQVCFSGYRPHAPWPLEPSEVALASRHQENIYSLMFYL